MVNKEKEGRFVELVDQYLDPNKFDRSIIKSVDQNSIMLERDKKEVEIRETDCAMHTIFSDANNFSATIFKRVDEPKGVYFKTHKGSKDLYTGQTMESYKGIIREKTVERATIEIAIKDALKEPSKSSDISIITCICSSKELKCKSTTKSLS